MDKEFEVTIVENLGWLSELISDSRFSIFSNLPANIQIVKLTDKDTAVLKEYCADQQVRSHPSQNLWLVRECNDPCKLSGVQKLKSFSFNIDKTKTKTGIKFIYPISPIPIEKAEFKITVVENLGWVSDLESNPEFCTVAVNLPRKIQIIKTTTDDTIILKRYCPYQLFNSETNQNLWMIWSTSREIPKGQVVVKCYEYEARGQIRIGLKYVGGQGEDENLGEKQIYEKIAKCHRDLAYYYSLLAK